MNNLGQTLSPNSRSLAQTVVYLKSARHESTLKLTIIALACMLIKNLLLTVKVFTGCCMKKDLSGHIEETLDCLPKQILHT